MSNTIDPGLKREKILNVALQAFRGGLAALSAFSTNMSADPVDEGDEISVPYIPLAAAAQDFDGSYKIQPSDWQKIKVAIDRHKYVSMGLSDKDVLNTPYATLEQQAQQKGWQLALAVWTDIMSVVTAINFPGVAFTGLAAAFDADDVADIAGVCDDVDMPDAARSLVLARAYYTQVVKDDSVSDQSKAGANEVLSEGKLPRIHGFTPYKTTKLPANGENLVGFAAYPSAIGVAVRYLQPQEGHNYYEARAVTDPDTGLTFGYRDWYDNDSGVRKQVFECNYGFKKIEAAALQRLRSAA